MLQWSWYSSSSTNFFFATCIWMVPSKLRITCCFFSDGSGQQSQSHKNLWIWLQLKGCNCTRAKRSTLPGTQAEENLLHDPTSVRSSASTSLLLIGMSKFLLEQRENKSGLQQAPPKWGFVQQSTQFWLIIRFIKRLLVLNKWFELLVHQHLDNKVWKRSRDLHYYHVALLCTTQSNALGPIKACFFFIPTSLTDHQISFITSGTGILDVTSCTTGLRLC